MMRRRASAVELCSENPQSFVLSRSKTLIRHLTREARLDQAGLQKARSGVSYVLTDIAAKPILSGRKENYGST
jgi:hypothetical protein